MFGKFRVMPAGCMAAALAVLLLAGMAAAEEKEEISYLSQFTASDYVELAEYDRIPVEANEGDTEGV